MVCEIRNTLIGMVIPSQAKLTEFQNTIGEVNNRFPLNYINSARSNFNNINNQITTSDISITIFGNTGNIDKSVLINSGLSSLFKGFFGILFYMLIFGLPTTGNEAMLLMLGALQTAWTGVISFYFGASSGDSTKDKMLYNSKPLE